MKLSRYIKIYPVVGNPGHSLLFSTRYSSCVMVPDDLIAAARDGSLDAREYEALADLGFVVSDWDVEREEMLDVFTLASQVRPTSKVIVVLNLDCNLACTYCYEGEKKGRHYFTAELADQLVCKLEREQIARGNGVNIDFFGGEPLLSVDLIRSISSRLGEAAALAGVTYSFSLVSNGTLLTRKLVRELLSLGLANVKVTIDGPRENHDRFRPFVSGKGSFDLILNNIKETCDLVPIQIGGNYSRDNYRNFPRLLDCLLDEGLTPDRLPDISFFPISATAKEYGVTDFSGGCCSTDEPWVSEATVFLRGEILRRGYYTPKVQPSLCMVEFAEDMVVNWDGQLYKCPALIGIPSLSVGSLKDGFIDYRHSHGLGHWQIDSCLECEYLPLCFGGCRLLSVLRNEPLGELDCKKLLLDATLEKMVWQDLQRGDSDDGDDD